jgi:hypothetical protein
MEENQMTPSEVTIKLGDHKEMIEELFEIIDQKDQEVWTLTEKVKALEETTTVIIKTFHKYAVRGNAEKDQRHENWQYGEGKSSIAKEGDRKLSHNRCKRAHNVEENSIESMCAVARF